MTPERARKSRDNRNETECCFLRGEIDYYLLLNFDNEYCKIKLSRDFKKDNVNWVLEEYRDKGWHIRKSALHFWTNTYIFSPAYNEE